MSFCRVRDGGPPRGEIIPPGDKSIGHRALLLGALAEGATRIIGLSSGDDNARTLRALRSLGVAIERGGEEGASGDVTVWGGGWRSPSAPLDLGNSGTTTRLLAGVIAGQVGLHATLVGDASLSLRPNARIVEPLRRMGAQLQGRGPKHTLPLEIEGSELRGQPWEMPVASAQVRSCLLLAGLRAKGVTAVRSPGPSRDHTARMLGWFGRPVRRRGDWVEMEGGPQPLRAPGPLRVPGDLSGAAFALVLAAPVSGARVEVDRVGLNPTRTGLLDALRRMGVDVQISLSDPWGGEPVGRVVVRGGPTKALQDDGSALGTLLDEVPLLALLATQADGRSRLGGLAELRVKESDRVTATVETLRAFGADIEEDGDAIVVTGPTRLVGARVPSRGDHRVAMVAAVAGCWAQGETIIEDVACVATSYPDFFEDLARLTGASITIEGDPDEPTTIGPLDPSA